MKYVAFIIVGLLLLATICYAVFWANTPRARLNVHVVRLTGTDLAWEPWGKQRVESPVWQVGITNTGPAPADWEPRVRYRNAHGEMLITKPWPFGRASGMLAPGDHTISYMTVPTNSVATWTVGIQYKTPFSPLEQKLFSWSKRVPKLRTLLPNNSDRFAYDTWHVGTNITSDH